MDREVCHFDDLPFFFIDFLFYFESFSFPILISAALCGTSKGIKVLRDEYCVKL